MSFPKAQGQPAPEWHVLLRGQRRGPYTIAALCDVLDAHPDGWSAAVWRPGMLDWRAAQEVHALVEDAKRFAREQRAPGSVEARGSAREQNQNRDAGAERAARHDQEPRSAPGESAPDRAHDHAPGDAGAARAPAPRARRSLLAVHTQPLLTPPEARSAVASVPPRAQKAPPSSADTTRDLPVYKPPAATHSPYWAAGAGALVALIVLLVGLKWLRSSATGERSAPTTQPVTPAPVASRFAAPAPRPPDFARAPNRALRPPELPSPEPAPRSESSAPALVWQPVPAAAAPSAPPQATTIQMDVRVRAAWAPVRAEADPTAEVLCSLPRGSQLAADEQRPGRHARWFRVHCDARTVGWLHENFLNQARPGKGAR